MNIPDFETFCKSFANTPAVRTVYFLRSWFITRLSSMQGGSEYTDFDELTSDAEIFPCDYVSRIVDLTLESFSHIVSSAHSEIIREDIMMPLYKVKEVDSYCINWLSRKSGRTIREKLAGVSSMMAVRRRESFDTGENRLLKTFAVKMSGLIQLKKEYLPAEFTSECEEFFLEKARQLLLNPDFQEVRRWENLPPNNTLLSDKYYSKIWQGWQELRELDGIIERDCRESAELIHTFFKWNLIHDARKFFVFPQLTVSAMYSAFRFYTEDSCILGYSPRSKSEMSIQSHANTLELSACGKSCVITFMPESIMLNDSELPVNAENISELVRDTARRLWDGQEEISPAFTNKSHVSAHSAVIDIFSVRPRYLADNDNPGILPFRIMTQRINWRYVSAAFSNALKHEWKIYTINGAVLEGSDRQLAELFRILGGHFSSESMTFIYPDFYNDFELAPLRRIANMYYSSARTLPKSIAAVFSVQRTENFSSNFKCGDAFIAADKVNGRISITLIRSCHVKAILDALPNSQGIQWEHHPQEDFDTDGQEHELKGWEKSYGAGGTETEPEDFTIKLAKKWQPISIAEDSKQSDVTEKVNDYISRHKDIIRTDNIHVLLLNRSLTFSGTQPCVFVPAEECLEGARYYERLTADLSGKISVPLWKDHLPELAIKRFGGELFYLVQAQSVNPVITQEGENIPISSTFTLPKGLPEHRFKLQKGEAGEALTYEAVVRHRVFPTAHDVPCRLKMTYRYGSDNPYTLYFEAIDPASAGFSSVLVDWQKEQIQTENLPYPHFPAVSSWESLYRYPLRKSNDNLFDWAVSQLNRGIKTEKIIDLSGCVQKIIGEAPYRKLIAKDFSQKRIYFIRESNFQGSVRISDRLGAVAMKCYPEKSQVLFADGLEWRYNQRTGDYLAIYYDDSGREIRFHNDSFMSMEEYSRQPDSVYYSLGKKNDRGWYRAEFVRCENDFPIYVVNGNVCRPDEIKVSGTDESAFKGKGDKKGIPMLFPLHKIFSEGRTLASPECPSSFRDVVARDIPYLVKMFRETKDDNVRENLIKILSLVTCPEYPDFYEEACKLLDDSTANSLPYEIGILIGDGKANQQKEILRRICSLKNKLLAVYMLSRALWKNPDLVFSIPHETLTNYLKAALHAVKFRPLLALEYVLAVLRLRSLNEEELNIKLSMRNPVMLKLCREVEKRIKEVKDNPSLEGRYNSRINFDDKTASLAREKKISVFLYALLSYITGEKGENEIKITEIKEEE